jgi:hypothetical protein
MQPDSHDEQDTAAHRVANRCIEYVDEHPRMGWYIAVIATGNFILSVLDLLA